MDIKVCLYIMIPTRSYIKRCQNILVQTIPGYKQSQFGENLD